MKIVALTGPSCAGKTTLARELFKTGHFCEVVSFTSRAPRAGEVHGVDYYFLGKEECQDIIDSNAAAEHIEFKGNIYGIEKQEIETKLSLGKIPLVIVEPHGQEQIGKMYGDEMYAVYVDAPLELLYERFLNRFKEDCIKNTLEVVSSNRSPLPEVDVKYHATRIVGIHDEWKNWKRICEMDFYIDHFTSDNKKSIIVSLVDVLLKEKEKSDKS